MQVKIITFIFFNAIIYVFYPTRNEVGTLNVVWFYLSKQIKF